MSNKDIDYKRLGSSVVNGVLRYTSVSQITSFDPAQFGGCNRKWWFQKVKRIREESTAAQETGVEIHRQIENYLETGIDALGIVARAGMRFIPKPGPNVAVEVPFGDEAIVGLYDEWRVKVATVADPSRHSTERDAVVSWVRAVLNPVRDRYLIAADVPLLGKIDVVNTRGEWIDDAGLIRAEPHVVEVEDWKTSSDIDKYAKGGEDLADTVQMIGYAKYASQVYGGEHFRVSHGYFQTRGAPRARKVTCKIPIDTVEERWYRVENVVNEMKDVARESDVSKVPANLDACSAYRGCSFAAQCPRALKTVISAAFAAADRTTTDGQKPDGTPAKETQGMSLLAQLRNKNNATPPATKPATYPVVPNPSTPPPAVTPPAVNPAVAAEMARLAAEEAAARPGTAPVAPAPPAAPTVTTSPADDFAAAVAKHAPAGSQPITRAHVLAWSVAEIAAVDAWLRGGGVASPPLHVHALWNARPPAPAVLPPDAPASTPPTNAAPVSAVDKAGFSSAVQEAVKAWEGNTSAPTAAAVPSPTVAPATEAPAAEPKRRGRAPKGSTPAAPPVADTTTPTPTMAEVLAGYENPDADVPMAFSGRVLFVDSVVQGIATGDFAAYVDTKCAELCAQYKAADILCAPGDSPLGYGKWKGALKAAIRDNPPAVGLWSVIATEGNEVLQTAVDAMRPLCAVVVRGVR